MKKKIQQLTEQEHSERAKWILLFKEFLRRELTNRYLGSAAGVLWVFVQPVIKLMIYSFVFSVIFKMRFEGMAKDGFLPFVAVGLWPWLAFSESLNRSVTAVTSGSALIKKIRFPHNVLVFSAICAIYILQLAGMLLVFVVLMSMGYTLHLEMLPIMFAYLFLQLMLSIGIGFILSSFQVFLQDVGQFMNAITMFLFYLTPILYSITLVPERYQNLYLLNPLAFFITRYRALILEGTWQPEALDGIAVCATLLVFMLGYKIFSRCSRRFEEFI